MRIDKICLLLIINVKIVTPARHYLYTHTSLRFTACMFVLCRGEFIFLLKNHPIDAPGRAVHEDNEKNQQ